MELAYTIKRSAKRKQLTITVERNRSVIIHAPESTSEEKIRQIVESKRQWIYGKTTHTQKYRELPHPPGKELVNGESALYLGRHYQIEITLDSATEIRFEQRFLIPASFSGERKQVLRNWYIDRAKEKILPRAKKFASDLGVEFANAKIVDNRYRWGSCTTKDNINFNWRLIKAPMYVLDYVIVHEITHLLEANHTPRFWNIVRAQSPKMEKAKQWLLENGQI
ncbi:M48 family metallopeptidase [Candidatus Contendibacter odensensis]|uniref:Zinc metalloprotease n=1 Tax=Candidatus Contendobacter odensis Run_B_J11 TaxID=1400861 RepID=A0A7U7J3I2_9GAMM|nr:SprT family zinc-dependent metalloprotease [Candidatus Contendobacter odensis]CDH44624.1 Zinc metalloprotease [Candidatus Contendobacter odensis Run_B_J11]